MGNLTKSEIKEVLDILDNVYPEAECALVHKNTFELIVAVALSAQTTDVSVNKVTPALFEKYKTPKELSEANLREVEDLIRTIGMYKNKAKNIVNLAKQLVEDYNGIVPDKYEELIKLSGVGRKTANVVLSVAFNQQRIAVDTHVFRLANRVGFVKEQNVLKTELSLMKKLPEERWSKTHHNLIFHGRNKCIARNPKCNVCEIEKLCKKVGVNK